MLPSEEDFPYAMRVVADILESNGSSSMATVCGGSLSMMDAGIPLRAPVAGVAMGLVKEGDEYAILTDIAGAEDHYGDMDFKVTGTAEGVTALQMDIKIQGITPQIMREALQQAKRGRLFILDKMNAVISEARTKVSEYAPRFYTLQIPTDKIRDLIGPGGKVIRGIVEATGVKIDVDDSGKVLVSSSDDSAATKSAANDRRDYGDGRGGQDLSRKGFAPGRFRRLCRDLSRHRRLAAYFRSCRAPHQGYPRRIEGRRPGAGQGAGGRRQSHPFIAQSDFEGTAGEDGSPDDWQRPRAV